MPAKKKRGRPELPAGSAKEARWIFRLLQTEAAEIEGAVKRSKKKKSDWIRDTLLGAARKSAA